MINGRFIVRFSHFHLSVIDGVVVYPNEHRCTKVGGMCVESDKCRSLVSAKGLCPLNQYRGVECCFEREFTDDLGDVT